MKKTNLIVMLSLIMIIAVPLVSANWWDNFVNSWVMGGVIEACQPCGGSYDCATGLSCRNKVSGNVCSDPNYCVCASSSTAAIACGGLECNSDSDCGSASCQNSNTRQWSECVDNECWDLAQTCPSGQTCSGGVCSASTLPRCDGHTIYPATGGTVNCGSEWCIKENNQVFCAECRTTSDCSSSEICSPGYTCNPTATCTDNDGDDYGINGHTTGCHFSSVDCNDNNIAIHPNANDVCENGVDEDCSGSDSTCVECTVDMVCYINGCAGKNKCTNGVLSTTCTKDDANCGNGGDCIGNEEVFYTDAVLTTKASVIFVWVNPGTNYITKQSEADDLDKYYGGFSKDWVLEKRTACCSNLTYQFLEKKTVEKLGFIEDATLTFKEYKCASKGSGGFCPSFIVDFGNMYYPENPCLGGWIGGAGILIIGLIVIGRMMG